MNEFQNVAKQWKRMCDACDNGEDVNCFIEGNVCSKFHAMKDRMNVAEIEKKVMRWAAEHPEPVYPTWRDALLECGLLYIKNDNKGGFEIVPNWLQMAKQIPADIAEKLGIEPKKV